MIKMCEKINLKDFTPIFLCTYLSTNLYFLLVSNIYSKYLVPILFIMMCIIKIIGIYKKHFQTTLRMIIIGCLVGVWILVKIFNLAIYTCYFY